MVDSPFAFKLLFQLLGFKGEIFISHLCLYLSSIVRYEFLTLIHVHLILIWIAFVNIPIFSVLSSIR